MRKFVQAAAATVRRLLGQMYDTVLPPDEATRARRRQQKQERRELKAYARRVQAGTRHVLRVIRRERVYFPPGSTDHYVIERFSEDERGNWTDQRFPERPRGFDRFRS